MEHLGFGRHYVSASILLEARIILRFAVLIELAPSGGVFDLRAVHSALYQLVLDPLRPMVREHQVVDDVAARIRISLNPKFAVRVLLERRRSTRICQ